ncbi:MAG TPA: mandelate racemase/muconate lactonizing enzyme family protein [Actinomycetota bacterium]|nr:mandelate racemase/muconate lactonizing enzyme family protein [Actinomycetota bacterium]
MKITSVRVHLCHFPLPETFSPSWLPGFPQMTNGCAIFRLQTDEGIEGVTASPLIADEAKGLVNLLRLVLVGRDPTQVEDIFKLLRSATRALGLRAWHVEPACWDLIGKAAGLPVWRLLGGARSRVRAYASTGELREPARRVEDVHALREQGFTAVKLRIRWPSVEEDVALVRAVREAHPDLTIMVDANQGWRVHGFAEYPEWDLARAVRTARALEELEVAWLEEPLDQFDYRGYAALRQRTSVPLAGGELLSDLHGFRDLVEHRAVDILQPDALLTGGILMARKVAGMAEAAGLGFAPHTWTNGIGLRVNLQVMGAAANATWCEYPIDPPGWTVEARDAMLAEPTRIGADGFVALPEEPGLGIVLDEERISAHGDEV